MENTQMSRDYLRRREALDQAMRLRGQGMTDVDAVIADARKFLHFLITNDPFSTDGPFVTGRPDDDD